MDRRHFLAAAAAGLAVPRAGAAESRSPMLPVIDTHQHLWNPTELTLSWLKPGDPLDGPFTPIEYSKATAGLNVVKAVYMEVDVIPGHQQREADYVAGLCETGQTQTRAAVVGGHPAGDVFAKYITAYKGHRYIKGVRQVLHVPATPAGYGLAPAFVKGVQLLGELGLSFDLCVRPAELPDHAKLVGLCPGTRFVLDHCGNPSVKFAPAEWDQWRKGLDAVAAHKNVVCKLSGFVVNAGKGPWTADQLAPAVNQTIDAFGIDRVMFGGDWPVVTLAVSYKDWLTAFRAIIAGRPEGDQRKALHDNAAKFYGI